MSSCRGFEEAIWEAADTHAVTPGLARHTAQCERCRASLRALTGAARGFETLRRVEAPDPTAAVWERLARPRRRLPRAAVLAAGVAACLLAAAAYFVVMRTPRAVSPTEYAAGASALRPGDVGMVARAFGSPQARTRHGRWRRAKQYDTFRIGEQFRTAESQALVFWFTDGTRMRVGPDTEVALLAPGKGDDRPATVRLERGAVSVAVARARSRFTVRTPAATATATGTRFGLDVEHSGRTTLAVFSGSVTLSNASGTVTATGPARTMAAPGTAPEEPVSIGMYGLLQGAPGTLRDDFDTPPLNEAVWVMQVYDRGVLMAQQRGRLTIRGARVGNSPYFRARLLTYYFPKQDFSAEVSFRVGRNGREGAGLDLGWRHSSTGWGVSFVPGRGYRAFGGGTLPPFGDEARVLHRLRLEYEAGTGRATGFVDGARVGSDVIDAPYFFLGFGTASATNDLPIALEFDDFEAHFSGGNAIPVSTRPASSALAVRSPGIVFDAGPPDAWDGGSAYNPTVLKRGKRYEMWYAGEPQGGNWRRAGIGLATSRDGIHWRRYAGNPVLSNPAGVGAPCVLYGDWRDGRGPYYKMWYRRSAPAFRNRPIKTLAYAESPDGIHWTQYGIIAGKSYEEGLGDLTSPSVLYLPDLPGLPAPYLLYYTTGSDSNGIYIAISKDGIHWKPHGVALEQSAPGGWDDRFVGASRVLFTNGKFHMFYNGYGSDPRFGSAIGYAVSDDGFRWRRSDRIALVGSHVPGEVDFGISQPFALVDGDTVRLWHVCGRYSGIFGFWGQNIGYAQMPLSSLSR